jgi:hypothetical protein
VTINAIHQHIRKALIEMYSSTEAGLIATELLEHFAGIEKNNGC